jgi:hypothetical protein
MAQLVTPKLMLHLTLRSISEHKPPAKESLISPAVSSGYKKSRYTQ